MTSTILFVLVFLLIFFNFYQSSKSLMALIILLPKLLIADNLVNLIRIKKKKKRVCNIS